MKYGILKSSTNTGLDSEILVPFMTPISVESKSPSLGGDSYTLRRISVAQPNQRWEIEAALASTSGTNGVSASVFGKNSTQNFLIRPPQPYRGSTYVSPSSVSVTGSSLSKGTTNMDLTGLGSVPAPLDEFIKFANHAKVYIITNSGSGGAGVEFYPPLLEDVPTTTAVVFGGSVSMRVKYDFSNTYTVTYTDGIITNPGSKRFVENWKDT